MKECALHMDEIHAQAAPYVLSALDPDNPPSEAKVQVDHKRVPRAMAPTIL